MKVKILYLQSELMGYHIPILKTFIEKYGVEVHVVSWDNKKQTPYRAPSIDGITYYKRSHYNKKDLLELANEINPTLVRVSGWGDKDYLYVCKKMKRTGTTIVVSTDAQWKNKFRQKVGLIVARIFFKSLFNYIWVAGPYQYEYARYLGFKKHEILFNCLSADYSLFSKDLEIRNDYSVPHKFVYLGRFEENKGVNVLLKAWEDIIDKKDWSLTFIGSGSLKDKLNSVSNVNVVDFLQPDDLVKEIRKYGFLILPSLAEAWALVIHEAMAAGIPVLATDVCGAVPVFIIPGFTGYTCPANNPLELQVAIEKIINSSDEKLLSLSKNASQRATVITPEIAAASLMSVILK